MIFFMICIGKLCQLWDEVFYTEESIKVYSKYARGEDF